MIIIQHTIHTYSPPIQVVSRIRLAGGAHVHSRPLFSVAHHDPLVAINRATGAIDVAGGPFRTAQRREFDGFPAIELCGLGQRVNDIIRIVVGSFHIVRNLNDVFRFHPTYVGTQIAAEIEFI